MSLTIITDQLATEQQTLLSPQALVAFFSALQEYPDFVDGLQAGRRVYFDTYGDDRLTPADMQHEIRSVFGKKNLDDFTQDIEALGDRVEHPHMFLLGQVLGEIVEGIQA